MDHRSGEFAFNFVCSSLRQRPIWASTATQLLQSDGRRWREANLVTHDIALSIFDPHTKSHDVYRLLLLSPKDIIDNPRTVARIQQLHRHSDGGNAALLFLLHHPEGAQAAMQPFMDLHIKLITHRLTLPIIPIASPSSDPNAITTALQTFQSSLAASRAAAQYPRRRPVAAARDLLLPYCTVAKAGAAEADATSGDTNTSSYISGSTRGLDSGGSGSLFGGGRGRGRGRGLSYGGNGVSNMPTSTNTTPALSNRAVEALSQRWFSFGELLGEMGSEEGQGVVREAVGAREGDGVVAFWGYEFEVAGG